MLAGWPAAAATLPRLVSINLCTDQLLIAMADPEQILGLSPYARDVQRSAVAREALRYPAFSGSAEEVMVAKPDLVLAGRYTKRATREMLKSQGLKLVELDAVASIAAGEAQIRRIGALIGHPERAEAKVAEIEAALGRAREAASRTSLSVLPFQRRGWVSGRETLMTSLLDSVGLRNAGAAFGRLGRQVDLETIVALKPDLLLLSGNVPAAEDQGSALLRHPALERLYPPERRLVIRDQMTVCGGPEIAGALDALAADVSRLR